MSSYDDSTLSSSNAFSPSFLHRIGQRDEPPSAGEADVAGPWRILERLIEALHVVERLGRSPEALANVLEAAGPLTLERAGALLDERIPDPES
ncbi:MAG: hypothetical protein ACJ76N_13400 [Thermoanaerobaculia bacterium]